MKRSRQAASCELCKGEATVYCEADSAHLCWSCDAAVHGANFLVARHVRRRLFLASSDQADSPASSSSSSSCVSSSKSTAATAKTRRRRRSAAAGRRRDGMEKLAGEVWSVVKGPPGPTCEWVWRRLETRLARPAEEGWAEC